MKNMKNSELFELLILNCEEDINNFIMENGKSPKSISPIRIFDKDEEEEEKNGEE